MSELEEEIRAKIEREYFPLGINRTIVITMWKQIGRVTVGKPDEQDHAEFVWDYRNRPKLFLDVIENIMKEEMKEEDIR